MSTFILNSILYTVLGCAGSKANTDTNTNEDEIDPYSNLEHPTESDDGWILGEVNACTNPLPEPTYTDASERFGYTGDRYNLYNIEGAIALQEYDGEWWLWQLGSDNPKAFNSSGDVVEVDASSVTVRLYILDLNEDGEDDLVLLGEFLEVVWSVLTPHEETEVLLEFEPSRGVRDVGLIDIDGDGDQDLWALIGSGGLDYHEGWGLIFERLEDGYSEPYEYLDRSYFGASFDGLVMDWEGDGDPDLYVCNDFGFLWGPNHVLINEEGSLTHGDAQGAGIETACMGTSAADMDMDQHIDLYSTATAGQHLLKGGDAGFVEYTEAYSLPIASNEQMLWGAHITDYNNDGLFDILVATSGFTRVDQNGPQVRPYPIWMVEQQPDHSYRDVGEDLGLEQLSASRAVLAHDINDDGVVDLIVSDAAREAYVYLSDGCTTNNWIEVSGPENSIVKVFAEQQLWTIHLSSTPGMSGSMPGTVHVGLGDIDSIDWIQIEIPWVGTRSLVGPIEARQHISFGAP